MQPHGRRLGFAVHINFDMITVCGLSRPSAQRWTAQVEQLPVDMRARLVSLGSIIEAVGSDGLPADTVKHLEGNLRATPSRQGWHRASNLRHHGQAGGW